MHTTHLHGHPARDDVTQALVEVLFTKITRELVGKGAEYSLQVVSSKACERRTDQHASPSSFSSLVTPTRSALPNEVRRNEGPRAREAALFVEAA